MTTRFTITTLLLLAGASFLFAQSKATEKMVQHYLEFYYPTTGEATYEIAFTWGTYTFVTGAGEDAALHPDSEPYRGYISARPSMLQNPSQGDLPSYLVAPNGIVWIHQEAKGEIPSTSVRREVTVSGDSGVTTTSTTTINSSMEPLVDHFLQHPEAWRKYGEISSKHGKSRLKLE